VSVVEKRMVPPAWKVRVVASVVASARLPGAETEPFKVSAPPRIVTALTFNAAGPLAAWQTPPWHVSVPLHALPSGQGVPSGRGALATQWPPWQTLAAWQAATALQLVPSGADVPCWQMPPWQVSEPLHGSPSSHEVPSGWPGHGPPAAVHDARANGFSRPAK